VERDYRSDFLLARAQGSGRVLRGGIVMLAEIAMRQALAHGRPTPAATPRKTAAKKYRIVR
jgi:hypothetical protein